ncbi:MAG: hypothetical protein V3R87_10835 [Dehalococcoidia bacterium]
MARTNLTDEQIANVIKLHQGGASWLAIENITEKSGARIPRRVAQRVYDRWARAQSTENLDLARREAARDEYRGHVDSTVETAEGLAASLVLPEAPVFKVTGAEHVAKLLREAVFAREAGLSQEAHAPVPEHVARHRRMRRERQAQWRLESLQEHTKGTVRWPLLKQWQADWDQCRQLISDIDAAVGTAAARLSAGWGESGKTRKRSGDGVKEKISSGVLDAIWKRSLTGSIGIATESITYRALEREGKQVFIVEQDKRRICEVDSGEEAAARVAGCREAVESLSKQADAKKLRTTVRRMLRTAEELDAQLDGMQLKATLYSTTCRFCPV